jgi:hypothetical protein
MSNAAQSWAWKQEGLLSSDKLVLVALADSAWDDGRNAFPSVGFLARKTSLCRRTVQTALRRLTEAGKISESSAAEPTKSMPTTYRLHMDPGAESAPPRAADAQAPAQELHDPPAQPLQEPRASDDVPPAHLTTDPRAAAAPELRTNQVQVQPKSKEVSPIRVDVEGLCTHLADRIEGQGAKRPPVTAQWRTQARLLIDADGRDLTQAHRLIDWAHNHEFWSGNILSVPKFRKQYDQLLLQARRDQNRGNPAPSNMEQHAALVRQLEAAEHGEIA